MKTFTTPKTAIAVAVVLAIGAALGWGIVQRSSTPTPSAHDHDHGEAADEHKEAAGEKLAGGTASHDAGSNPADGATKPAIATGPNGGKLFRDGDYSLEITIFEDGVPPEFRVYAYMKDKPMPANGSTVQIKLERLGRPAELIRFTPKDDYLRGDAEVVEPHSFNVSIEAKEGARTHRFEYAQEEGRVTMTDAQLQQAGVTVATAGPARIGTALELLGEVRNNADRTVQVLPRLTGVVEQVLVSAGQSVRKGQVLAILSSPALADLRAEALATARRTALARTIYEREKQLWEDKITARQDYQQAQVALQEAEIAQQNVQQKLANLNTSASAGQSLTRYELRAPVQGVVTDQQISVGAAVADNSPVFTISDLASVWVEAPVAAKDLPLLQVGQTVEVSAAAFDTRSQGKVTYISALLGEQTRTATVRVVLSNPQGLWKPGLPVKAHVATQEAEVPVAIQAAAVQSVRDWQVVFGRYGNQLEARPLELGRSDGRMVEVKSGLLAGERYAAGNSFVVKAELGKAGASHDH